MRPHLLLLALLPTAVPASLPAQRFAALDAAVQDGIRRGTFPGAAVVVGRTDTVLHTAGYGHLTWSARDAVPDPATSLWDLASLSKVVATTSAIAVLVDRGELNLDAPVMTYLPEFFGGGKD